MKVRTGKLTGIRGKRSILMVKAKVVNCIYTTFTDRVASGIVVYKGSTTGLRLTGGCK